jgi:hypothetical protein
MSTFPAFFQPLSFALGKDRYLFADAFIADDHLVLVSTFYPDVLIAFDDVRVVVDGVRLTVFEEVAYNEYEPVRVVRYPLPARAQYAVAITYGERTLSARLSPDPITTPTLALATLFKHDAVNVELCYRYYRAQGFERFYFFYNGDLNQLDREGSRCAAFAQLRTPLPRGPDIVYGSWPFTYWIQRDSPAFNALLLDPQAAHNTHHAQMLFLSMVRERFLRRSSHLALVDLDELLHVPGETLAAHLTRTNPTHISAPNHWAALTPPPPLPRLRGQLTRTAHRVARYLGAPIPPRRVTLADLATIYANPRHEGAARIKTIYRGDFAGHFGVHHAKPPTEPIISDALRLYHLVDTAHARHDHIAPDAHPVHLLSEARL